MLTLKYLENAEEYEIEAIQLFCYFMSRDNVWNILKALNNTERLTTSELAEKCHATESGIFYDLKFLRYINIINRTSISSYNKTYEYSIDQQEACNAEENCHKKESHLMMKCALNSPEMRLDFIKDCTPHWLKGDLKKNKK